MIYMIEEYISDAKTYKTYNLADKLENNPHMWVDNLSDDHIEVHSSDYNGKVFCEELTKFINNNIDSCKIEMMNERLFVNQKYCKVPYAIIYNING